MKKLIILSSFLVAMSSCVTQKDAVEGGNSVKNFEEVPCTCSGISGKKLTKDELLKQLVVSIYVKSISVGDLKEGSVLLAPPVSVDPNSYGENGALIRELQIDGEAGIIFNSGSHFLITSVSDFETGKCPKYITANIKSKNEETEVEKVFTLKFQQSSSRSDYYVPVVSYENGSPVVKRQMYKALDRATQKDLWIQNKDFRLDKLYLLVKKEDNRDDTERTKGYSNPNGN